MPVPLFAAVGAVGVGLVSVKPLLAVVGFTQAGVAGGTIAAAWQASLGNVVMGSAFAILQSLGAGAVLGWTWPVGVVGLGLSLLRFGLLGW